PPTPPPTPIRLTGAEYKGLHRKFVDLTKLERKDTTQKNLKEGFAMQSITILKLQNSSIMSILSFVLHAGLSPAGWLVLFQ
ncbi:hypothetical protein L916_21455, partial [Phytophthora nicotianae]